MRKPKQPLTDQERANVQTWVVLTRDFLHKYREAAGNGMASAKHGFELTGEDKFRNEMQYWKHCVMCCDWLLLHATHYGMKHAREGPSHVGK